jgi:hypothetical protein
MFFGESDVANWQNNIKDYTNTKKALGWKEFSYEKPITHAEMKKKDLNYNLVLAQYSDPDKVSTLTSVTPLASSN